MPDPQNAPTNPTDAADAPCALGLLVGSLALMTAYLAPETRAKVDADTQRDLMAARITGHLLALQHHADAPPPLRRVAAQLRERWLQRVPTGAARPLAGGSPDVAPDDAVDRVGSTLH